MRPPSSELDAQYAIGVGVTSDRLVGLLLDLDGVLVDLDPAGQPWEVGGRSSLRRGLSGADVPLVVGEIAALVGELAAARPDLRDQILGVGVSIGGHVDREAGLVRFSPGLGWTEDVRLADLLKQETGFDAIVENDVNVLVDAEQWSGAADRYGRFAIVKIGHGIGCGLSLHRGLERGATGAAGELGHIPYERDGRHCVCGKRGCLQTVASSDAILRFISEWGGQVPPTIDAAIQEAKGGNELAARSFERAGEALGIGLATLLNIVNLEAVILCGDASLLAYDSYVGAARRSLAAHAFSTTAEDCDLLIEVRTDELEAQGAASMALDTGGFRP